VDEKDSQQIARLLSSKISGKRGYQSIIADLARTSLKRHLWQSPATEKKLKYNPNRPKNKNISAIEHQYIGSSVITNKQAIAVLLVELSRETRMR
jgi:hypothetical protein